jgi:hypothetical protein
MDKWHWIKRLGAITCVALLCSNMASAQVALTGGWRVWNQQDNKIRAPGPDPDSFYGLPINDAARDAALAYTAENISEVDRQCAPWPVHYITLMPFSLEIWPTKKLDGTVIAWNIGGSVDRTPITIWMDGRPHPSAQAANTPGGFTTGVWRGDTLVTTTTHIQDGYVFRNGVPSSDREVFTMLITRHENWLTITGIVHDPVYLTAPYVTGAVFSLDPTIVNDANAMGAICTPEEEVETTAGVSVPSHLTPPEAMLNFATAHHGIPREAAMGGERTMYPEFSKAIRGSYQMPKGYCKEDCCGSQGPDGRAAMDFNIKVLMCRESNP